MHNVLYKKSPSEEGLKPKTKQVILVKVVIISETYNYLQSYQCILRYLFGICGKL
jgi:hypothetical protein